MPEYKRRFDHEKVLGGVVLIRLEDKASVFLQGDDCSEFMDRMEQIDELWAEYGDKPFGPWSCQAHHEDAMIEQYDHIMTQGVAR